MTKRTRTILFLICLFLFLLIAPSAIFYSQGYRFDIDSKKITQTGGLFLKVIPKQVEVFLDGKLKKKTDFFFGSALIENLLPKKYKIEVKKEGYHPWEKNLEIKEKQVTEAKNIVLFPENPNFIILTKDVEDFWFSPDERKIILKEVNEKGWSLKLFNLERSVKNHLIEEKDVYPGGADLFGLEFSQNSKEISLEIGMKEQIKYFRLEVDKIPPILEETKPPLPEDILTQKIIGEDIFYFDKSGYLFKNEEKLTEELFPVEPETKYVLEVFQDFIFLQEGQTLYQFNPNSKLFEKFFEPIKEIEISPELKKLVYFSDFEIWILFLKEKYDWPQKKAGEKLFLLRLSEKINNVLWLNPNYLIYNIGNNLKIIEIDNRDRINIVDIAEFKNPKIFWNNTNKKLYVLSEGALYRSRKLLP